MTAGVPDARSGDAQTWPQWRRAVFGDPYLVWHEGPDFTTLLTEARTDPAAVTRMLTAGLRESDPLAASSFGVLAEARLAPRETQELLRAALPNATGTFLVRLAQALHAVTGDAAWAVPVAAVLNEDRFWGERIDAAMALARFPPTRDLVNALATAACDPEYLVRYHAANTLLRYAGSIRDLAGHPALYEQVRTPVTGDAGAADRAAWKAAADTLAARAHARLAAPVRDSTGR